ncbi:hypothetical protein CK203_058393 [Vitis vinifera]|uniref:Uncharacterized protein n=1 Tax=Vitis vinifera TaxID=29760 RepID=A0A438GI70_VITVI|nr:hypothetical protein CK203_058393 [Vitis vinifera]
MVHILSRRASTNPHLLRRELPPRMFLIDALLRHKHLSTTALDLEERSSLEALFRISEGYFFGPHHLIMVALLYFEEKVHKKKLQRADAIPLLFPRLLFKFWNIWGIHQILSWSASVYAERRASPDHIPEGIPIASPTISRAPPVTPASSEPSTSVEQGWLFPFQRDGSYSSSPGADVDHLGSAYCHLEQLQHHLGLPSAAEHLTPTTAVPHS